MRTTQGMFCWLALVLIAALTLGGCASGDTVEAASAGDLDPPDAGSADTDTVATPGEVEAVEDAPSDAAGEPVRLGVVLSLTGRFAESAELMRNAYELWADDVNARGGLGGQPVELVVYDDESTPETAAVLARRLLDADEVFTVLGPYGSGSTEAMAVVMEEAQLPMIATLASDSGLWDQRDFSWSFQAFPSSTYDHEAFLNIAAEQGVGSIAILYEEVAFSTAAAEWAQETAAEMGMEVTLQSYPPDQQDFTSIVERLVTDDPQAVSMGGYYAPSVSLTNAMIQRGYSPPAYHFILAGQGDTIEALGDNAEAVFGRSAWEPLLATEGNEAFVEDYTSAFEVAPSYHAAMAYAGGQLLEAAVAEAGLDAAGIREFLATEAVETIAGTYEVNERGQQVGYRYVGVQWQDGERAIVYPEDLATAPVVWPKAAWQ